MQQFQFLINQLGHRDFQEQTPNLHIVNNQGTKRKEVKERKARRVKG